MCRARHCAGGTPRQRLPPRTMSVPGTPREQRSEQRVPAQKEAAARAISVVAILPVFLFDQADRATLGAGGGQKAGVDLTSCRGQRRPPASAFSTLFRRDFYWRRWPREPPVALFGIGIPPSPEHPRPNNATNGTPFNAVVSFSSDPRFRSGSEVDRRSRDQRGRNPPRSALRPR